jgi:hypothetical protein
MQTPYLHSPRGRSRLSPVCPVNAPSPPRPAVLLSAKPHSLPTALAPDPRPLTPARSAYFPSPNSPALFTRSP